MTIHSDQLTAVVGYLSELAERHGANLDPVSRGAATGLRIAVAELRKLTLDGASYRAPVIPPPAEPAPADEPRSATGSGIDWLTR